MSVVRPIELTPGLAWNQTLTGRVCLLESGIVQNAAGAFEYVDLHLVAEEGLTGTLYIEAWCEQARRLSAVANEGKILNLTNLSIKALGELAKMAMHTSAYIRSGAGDNSSRRSCRQ